MDGLMDIINSRRSIRKFLPDEISDADIREIIEAGTNAPSACNSQCWRFITVKDRELIDKIASEAGKGIARFYEGGDFTPEFIDSRAKHITFFKNAPLVIFVYLDEVNYYEERTKAYYKDKGYSYRQMMDFLGYPDILSLGAAIQNILLVIHGKGLGACWMNDPIAAKEEINAVLGLPEDSGLISVIPVGYPAYTPRDKQKKSLNEVLNIIG